MFTDVILDEARANATCRSEGCENTVIKPFRKIGKSGKPWYNYMTRCSSCQHNMHEYGITAPERDALLAQQSSACKVCDTPISFESKTAHVDHCHSSGKVRGILCFQCNTALGNFRDNVLVMQRAIEYLKENYAEVH